MSDPRRQQRPLFRVFDRDPDRHRPVDAEFVAVRPARVHRPGPWRTALVLVLAVAGAWVGLAAVVALSLAHSWLARIAVLALASVLGIGLVWLTARILAVGPYVNDRGLRLNRVLSAEEVDWTDVVDVRRVAARVPVLGIGPRTDGERVVLVLRDGEDLVTTLTSHSADFLLRPEAYDMAAMALDRWWQESRTA